MGKFEKWVKKTNNPKIALWKRPTFLVLSIVMTIGTLAAAYTQIEYHWTNDGIWFVIFLLGVASTIGLFVSIFCKDFWVALVLANI